MWLRSFAALLLLLLSLLTHWGRMTHICVSNLTTIGSDNGLSPGRPQAIIWTNAGILLMGSLWTNFSEILIEIPTFSFKKMRLKVSSAKSRSFCLGLNVLMKEPLMKFFNFELSNTYITGDLFFNRSSVFYEMASSQGLSLMIPIMKLIT